MKSTDGNGTQGQPAASAQVASGPGTGWREAYIGGTADSEQQAFAGFASQIGRIQNNIRDKDGASAVRRAFHAKIVGGVTNAELRVSAGIPKEFQVGPFQPGAVYPASVRFSNASGSVLADGKKDLRGLAFRITAPGGIEQDFLMTNAPASHARDAQQFMVAAVASASPSRLAVIPALVKGLGPAETVRLLRVVLGSSRKIDSLATERYWSRAPITWGPLAVRYLLRPGPDSARSASAVDTSARDYLRDDLAGRLRQGPVTFELQLQRFVDEARTPIEDATRAWRDGDSPPQTIATLVIPQQDLDSPDARRAEAEVDIMEFNPWNTTPDFRPLGSQNRARKDVYAASARNRAGQDQGSPNAQPASEGVAGKVFWGVTGPTFRLINRFVPWHRLPPVLGIFNLGVFREDLRHDNLYSTYGDGPREVPAGAPAFEQRFLKTRTSDGYYNDLSDPAMGSRGYRFGRNFPLEYTFPEPEPVLMKPSPREVSNQLLKRDEFIPATSLNLLAAAWIQFQIHDWIAHELSTDVDGELEIPLLDGDPWTSRPMRVRRTPADKTRGPDEAHRPPTFTNRGSHWWDGSQIYGSDEATTRKLRAGKDGKLAIDDKRFLLPLDPATGIPLSGLTDNWWVGLALLHTLFTREHNAICDRVRSEHPYWADDQVFDTARMVNTALMAKIHTVDWTPAILSHPTLQIGMDANWWGLQTRTLHRIFGRLSGSEAISGIPGSEPDHHAAPYSLTEEFVSVYRLHPLMPDEIGFHSVTSGAPIKNLTFAETAFAEAAKVFDDETTMSDAFYSFGIAHPGAITLHNFPNFLRDLTLPDGQHLDLAAVDVLRDRERGVPRYTTFRRLLRRGAVKSFDDITSNKQWARELREMYDGDVNRVDLMVGMYAEDLPAGFGFSDTAFRIFILMASRRLKSDRFFTSDYTPEVYTPGGLDWIESNSMTTVLLRHYPELAPALRHVGNAFAPWQRLETL